jgi:hypothetical protein
MRRIQFIEIHEQPWFPGSIRDQITDTLQFGFNFLKVYSSVVTRLQAALDSTQSESPERRAIVDLCSGGGGPWFHLARQLHSRTKGDQTGFQIWLTDKYPNSSAHQNANPHCENRITFYPKSVDATKVPQELRGFRTMFTSFHHFSPEDARKVLQNAVDAGEGIGVFEITGRSPAAIVRVFVWVGFLFLGTPWVRPFRWTRLLWTYLVPIIPAVLIFDGIVSCLRTYRQNELQEIVKRMTTYRWEIAEDGGGVWKPPITCLTGYPDDYPNNEKTLTRPMKSAG